MATETVTDEQLRAFIGETLALWGVAASVEPGIPPAVACVGTAGAARACIERAPAAAPFRWQVRWAAKEPSAPGYAPRARACASITGALNALRAALGVARAGNARVVPAPVPAYADPRAGHAPPDSIGAAQSERLAPPAQRIPVSVITGFLGSGKTTLLARLLRDPAMGRTAVIINEFGEIGLDHDLIEAGDETYVQLATGCLCCRVRSDLVLTLGDLAARRAAGTLPPFERVVIETSGLAEPAPVLHALMTDAAVAEAYAIENVVTTVDALTGLDALERHSESLHQVALADRLVFTKTDLAGGVPVALKGRVAAVNPGARACTAVRGAIGPSALFDGAWRGETAAHRLASALAQDAAAAGRAHAHDEEITTFSIRREAPVRAATLPLLLCALAENCGADLLRVKGIVNVAEDPDRPAVIHGVQHVYHAPVWLERWPSADRRTRIVFIGRRVPSSWASSLLALLDLEVADEIARRHAAAS